MLNLVFFRPYCDLPWCSPAPDGALLEIGSSPQERSCVCCFSRAVFLRTLAYCRSIRSCAASVPRAASTARFAAICSAIAGHPRKERARRHSYHHLPLLNLSGRRVRRRRRQPLAAQGGGNRHRYVWRQPLCQCVGRRFFKGARVALICHGAGLHVSSISSPFPPLHPSTRMLGRSVCDL